MSDYEENTTRAEHLLWCKLRAYEYLETDQPDKAIFSIQSDLQKHAATCDHIAVELAAELLISCRLDSVQKVRQFIDAIY